MDVPRAIRPGRPAGYVADRGHGPQGTGVGRRRSRRPTSPRPRSRSPSSAPTATRSTGSSPGPPRAAASCSCGAGRRPPARPLARQGSASAAGCTSTAAGPSCLVPGRAAGAFAYVDQADQRVWFCEARRVGPRRARSSPEAPGRASSTATAASAPRRTATGSWPSARSTRRAPAGRCTVSSWRLASDPPRRRRARRVARVEGHDFFGAPRSTRPATAGRGGLGPPRHAVGRVVARAARARPATPDGLRRRVRRAPGASPAARTSRSASRPWAARRRAALRLGPARLVAALRLPGGPGDGCGARAAHRRGGRVPRARLGARPGDHGRARRRHARRRAGRRRAATTLVAGSDAGAPDGPQAGAAQPCVVDRRASARTATAWPSSGATPDAPADRLGLDPGGRAAPLRAPGRPRARRSGRADVAAGEPFTLDRALGPSRARHALPPDAGAARSGSRRAGPPPLVTWCHGGPTSSCQAGLDLTVQFFTTRGFAVACVDYAGSSGYGRAYRCALWGRWGVADSEDCLDAALHLAARGDVDARAHGHPGRQRRRHDGAQRAGRGGGVRAPAPRGTGSPT